MLRCSTSRFEMLTPLTSSTCSSPPPVSVHSYVSIDCRPDRSRPMALLELQPALRGHVWMVTNVGFEMVYRCVSHPMDDRCNRTSGGKSSLQNTATVPCNLGWKSLVWSKAKIVKVYGKNPRRACEVHGLKYSYFQWASSEHLRRFV